MKYCLTVSLPGSPLVFLFTLCHTILMMLVWRIWSCNNYINPLIDIFPYSQHFVLDTVLVWYGVKG